MAGILKWIKFSEIDLNDSFFDSLKDDYPEFTNWFAKKRNSEAKALVSLDDVGITGFLYLKEECEEIILSDKKLPPIPRLKIGTFKLSNRLKGSRQGEGTLGIALWEWQKLKLDEIYVTVFLKHDILIRLLERYGFTRIGFTPRGENVYMKNRKHVDFGNPYKSFPFVKRGFANGFLLPIDDFYHDKLFPYSELASNSLEVEEIVAGNGISKIFIGFPKNQLAYIEGKPILIYRIHTGTQKKTFASCITSLCTIHKITWIKQYGSPQKTFDDFKSLVGNKAVFSEEELNKFYIQQKNIVVIELLYNSFFGKGHNVPHYWLHKNKLFEDYPYKIKYSEDEVIQILSEAFVDVQNVIID